MKLINRLLSNPIVKNLSVLVVGTIVAQCVVIGFQVFVRRQYSPSDFGAFAVYMSIVGILSTIASLRYEQTIVLPAEASQGKALLKISLWSVLLFSIIISVVLFLTDDRYLFWLGFPMAYKSWLYFIPFSVLILSVYQALNYYLIRKKMFTTSASNKIFRRISEGVTMAGFGFFTRSFGLFIGDIVGQVIASLVAVFKLRKEMSFNEPFNVDWQLVKKYKKFPINNGIPSLMNAMSLLLPILIVNRHFSEDVTGYFDLARMVLIVPLSLITASLSQVILQQFSEAKNKKESILSKAITIFSVLVLAAILFVIIIKLFGIQLFSFVFGEAWGVSGEYASIMVWAFALKFIISPFNISFTAFEKIGWLSVWQMVYFALIIYLYVTPFQDIETFLVRFVLIELISYTVVGIMNGILIASYEQRRKH